MSIQELKAAVRCLPLGERSTLLAELAAQIEIEVARLRDADNVTETLQDSVIQHGLELAAAAAPFWAGGDGLTYQTRIRSEWDDRSAES